MTLLKEVRRQEAIVEAGIELTKLPTMLEVWTPDLFKYSIEQALEELLETLVDRTVTLSEDAYSVDTQYKEISISTELYPAQGDEYPYQGILATDYGYCFFDVIASDVTVAWLPPFLDEAAAAVQTIMETTHDDASYIALHEAAVTFYRAVHSK